MRKRVGFMRFWLWSAAVVCLCGLFYGCGGGGARLTPSGTVVFRYDIPGAAAEGEFHLQRDIRDENGSAGADPHAFRKLFVTNGEELVLADVTPGSYTLGRSCLVRVGDMVTGVLLDDQRIEVRPGETTRASFVRQTEGKIAGDIVGLSELDAAGAFIYVQSPGPTPDGDPSQPTTYAALTCGPGGRFYTEFFEPVDPGEYVVVVEVYTRETASDPALGGLILPDYTGRAAVTVPPEGDEAYAYVRIELEAFAAPEDLAGLAGRHHVSHRVSDDELIAAMGEAAAAAGASPEMIEHHVGVPANINTTRGNDKGWLSIADVGVSTEGSTDLLPTHDPSWEFVFWDLTIEVESHNPQIVGVAWDEAGDAHVFFGEIYPP